MVSLLPLLLLLALLDVSRATNFEVGGDAEWVVPQAGDSQTYNHWASKNHFHVGDIVRKSRRVTTTNSLIDRWLG